MGESERFIWSRICSDQPLFNEIPGVVHYDILARIAMSMVTSQTIGLDGWRYRTVNTEISKARQRLSGFSPLQKIASQFIRICPSIAD
jgi:hypothetical protein